MLPLRSGLVRAALVVLLALAATAAGSQPVTPTRSLSEPRVFANGPEGDDPRYTWAALTPVMVLDILRQHPGRTMWLFKAPPGWITEPDLIQLRRMVGSDEPTAVTCPFIAAHSPSAGASSSIGKEARNMVRAAEHGWSWPLGCSDL